MTTAVTPQPATDLEPVPILASTALSVVMRVAGPVPTDVRPHALGHPEQQASARIGDAIVYLTNATVAARIRQQWDAAQYLASARLPEQVSQTWLAPQPGSYPLAIALRLTGSIEVTTQWITGRRATNTPAHPRVRVDRLVWQVCDSNPGNASAKPGSTRSSTSPPDNASSHPTTGCGQPLAVHNRWSLGFSPRLRSDQTPRP